MAMPTETQILTLAQWFSPAYPVGAFAYSHGLEWAVDAGDVGDAKTTQAWISDVLKHGAGWNDCLFISAAYQAASPQDLTCINDMSLALSASSERMMETRLQGEAFCGITASVWTRELAELSYPVVVGRAANLVDLPLRLTTQFYLHAFMANLVAAATRLVPLGQTDGQQMIRDLTPRCQAIAGAALSTDLSQLASTAFLSDIAAMKHETQYSRMFRT
ncbi:urease accessory protein UreF [Alisedimentitalea sp. MJ-SS2]|uniref:urease accessory protein UreF n=1 Tax=Aliisedimentitalea sp. MJ-SS2 TaxID=3049795 RepID=UPI002908AC9A|nr:urease accessory protein UreF [Alisedimentitalea sp. MJ-SS2]MDU8928067.1 urease accessory protein UreF [Alisedimentitalea sp. MJ-SS2]